MITAALILAAVYLLAGDRILQLIAELNLPQVERKHVAAAALIAGAAIAWTSSSQSNTPTPAPAPAPGGLNLRGTFVGPDAAADAATVAALMDELASEIEWDSMQTEPLIRTGVALDDLRQRSRELRCRGVSLGEKHPRAREAIKNYLDAAAGTSGGPLSPAQRSAWVAAYRDIARAAADASR